VKKSVLEERKASISDSCGKGGGICCEKESVSGAVSQRACVYCGARVVLNPITDAYHIVHGPIGCASYTWDIRGSLTSGAETYRNSFSTDLRETDIVFGGEKKLAAAIDELMEKALPAPKLIFVFATCIVGVTGDDVDAVCGAAEAKHGIRVIPVKAPGFSGTKTRGYKLACDAIMALVGPHAGSPKRFGVNILGDYNLAGEMWIIRNYLEEIGIPVISTVTGDSSCEALTRAPQATLNIVQCAGSSAYLAERMEAEFGIPYIKVSFFGVEDTTASLLRVADALGRPDISANARAFAERRAATVMPVMEKYRPRLEGKRAAIFVGGGFKAISLIRQFNELGMETVVVGTQTGKKDEYETIAALVGGGAVVLDDANPAELERFMLEKRADILVGGVKERPLAYKLGMAFCDHNHERKHPLAGFEGIENFVKEIHTSINSPVWKYVKGDAA
jgi:nitrogenase molybdenum-cofactor synthesis protein NifE